MADIAPPTFKKRATKTLNNRKRTATPPPEDSDSGSDLTSDDSEAGVRIKRRKKEGLQTANISTQCARDLSKSTSYTADRSTAIAATDDATRTSNWYESDKAALPTQPKPLSYSHTENNGTYKGTSHYTSHIQINPETANRQVGPQKGPTNVRTITVTDFAPDVCKDYKQTGFCGFGDSCKFLHAREDYKQGWQLDKEWEKAGKPNGSGSDVKGGDNRDEEEKLLEGIPFKCIICKEDYKLPVVTRCGHYFCERCAMTRYMKEKRKGCANCGKDTRGSFGVAKKLGGLLGKKRQREEKNGEVGDKDVA